MGVEVSGIGGAPLRWNDLNFNASDFSASGGGNTWNIVGGNVLTYHYWLSGNVMTFDCVFAGFTVTGAPSALFINMPFVVMKNCGAGVCFGNPTGFTNGLMGYCLPVNPGVSPQMRFQLANTGGTPTWAGATEMFAQVQLEVNF